MKLNFNLISASHPSFLPVPACVTTRTNFFEAWTAEDHCGQMKIEVSNDTLDITAPKGLTLWYNTRLTDDYEITYRVKDLCKAANMIG